MKDTKTEREARKTRDKGELNERNDQLIDLYSLASENSANHYEDYNKSIVAIDAKAQAAATASGIVFAALIAISNSGKLSTSTVSTPILWIVAICCTLSVATIILSILTMWFRKVSVPYDSKNQIKEALDLGKLPEKTFSSEEILNFHKARLDHWASSIEQIEVASKCKGILGRWAQGTLIATFIATLLLFVLLIIQTTPSQANPIIQPAQTGRAVIFTANFDGFASGEEEFKCSDAVVIEKIQNIRKSLSKTGDQDHKTVALLIGSTDRSPLSPMLRRRYESNAGLARARVDQVEKCLITSGLEFEKMIFARLITGPSYTAHLENNPPDIGKLAADREVRVLFFDISTD